MRYRALAHFNIYNGEATTQDKWSGDWNTPRVTHGLNIGLSMRF